MGPRKRRRQKFLLMKPRSVRGEAGKGKKKSERKVQGETERRGQMGGWPAEITAWVAGQVTAAIDLLIGCLTVSTRLPKPLIRGVSHCVCLCVSVCQKWVLSVPRVVHVFATTTDICPTSSRG